MKHVGTIQDILNQKGSTVWTISPDSTMLEAIQFMVAKNIGALLVVAEGKTAGILSERDYVRNVRIKGKFSDTTFVREVMSDQVMEVTPEHSVDDCLRIMTDKRVRHLPVVQGGKLLGLVSIGDLVNWVINVQSSTINQLENYIAGNYPG